MSRENDAERYRRAPTKTLLTLAGPITISMMSYSLMTLADTLFVSSKGAAALAAVGLGGVLAFAIIAFPMGFLRASKIIVSQAVGAGDDKSVKGALSASLFLAFTVSLVCVAAGFLVSLNLSKLTSNPEVGEMAGTYLWIRLLASPWVLCFVSIREFRYGKGDTRLPMWATLAGNISNIILDALFILGLDMGPAGAALATAIAQGIQLVVLFAFQKREGFYLSYFKRKHLWRLVVIGAPTGAQFLFEVMSFSLMTAILSTMNEVELAAHQIALQLTHFVFLPCAGLCEAASVLAGQFCGERRYKSVLEVALRTLKIVFAYCALGALTFVFAPDIALQFFGNDAALQARATELLKVAALFQIFDGALVVAYFTLRGAGDVKVPAAIAVASAWICTPTLAWFLGVRCGYGALGAWWGLCCEIILVCVLLWARLLYPYRKGFREEGWVRSSKKVL